MNQVIALKVVFPSANGTNAIYPTILKDDRELILVDCGYSDSIPQLKEAALTENISLNELTKIIITHHDHDHTGNLANLKQMFPNVEILSSEKEAEYISGKKKALRLQKAESTYAQLPEDQKEGAKRLIQVFGSVKPVAVDKTVRDSQVFPWCGGVEIVATPGHMPGHISLYVKECKTLITGDALGVQNGELGLANPHYMMDMETAKRSAEKLLRYDIERVICYHGGVWRGDFCAAIRKALS